MRLFIQLSDEEKTGAIEHCINSVIEDLFEDSEFIFDMIEDEEVLKLNEVLENAKNLDDPQQRVECLMNDQDTAKIIFKIAEEMAKATYYHEPDELILYTDTLVSSDERMQEKENKKYSLN